MAFYATMSLQDSISVYTNFQIPWWVIITIAFFIMVYFYYLSIANKRVGVIQNNIMVFIKFIPILFSIFGGLIIYAYLGEPQNPVLKVCNAISSSDKPMTLTKLTPFLGVIASIPAIFFAFDGFYASSGLYSDLKDKKYFSTGISLGIIITAIVYLLISLGLLLGAKDGNITSVLSSMPTNVGKAISFIVEFCIF
jgi:amino acid transporter